MGQDFEDWELIVKDGGSKFAIREQLPDDGRIRLVERKDLGIFDAMNQGLDEVSGQFICFLNAGDSLFASDVLGFVAQACKQHPMVEFFYGDVAKPTSRSGFELYPERLSRRFLFSRGICHQAWFVRHSVYDRLGGYETDLPSGGDPRYLLRMVLEHQVSHRGLRRPVVTYQGGGLSQVAENREGAQKWVAELKAKLFTPAERSIYGFSRRIKCVFKRLVYDPFAWRMLRCIRYRKYRGG